jgi:hypothetical protein
MRKYLTAVAMTAALAMSASAQVNPQQQRMTECSAQAKGMTGEARKNFMSTCLSGGSAGLHRHGQRMSHQMTDGPSSPSTRFRISFGPICDRVPFRCVCCIVPGFCLLHQVAA